MSRQETEAWPLIRLLISLAGGALGWWAGEALQSRGAFSGPNLVLYLAVLGALIFYLAGGPLAPRLGRGWQTLITRLNAVAPDAWLAAVIGAIVALVLTVLLNSVLSAIPGFTWYWSLLVAMILVLGIGALFVSSRRLFIPLRASVREPDPEPAVAEQRSKLIDTSAIIDGRVVDVFAANFLEGTVLIPRFVLKELQSIADDADPDRRKRGRRGLEVLSRLSAVPGVVTEVIDDDPASEKKVDDKLMALAVSLGADLITTDFNLEKIAAVQGIRVLNPNQLAAAVRALYLPGDQLTLTVSKQGREPGQGLAYLADGTMVVIEEAAHLTGNTIQAVVTSSLQTNVGRMIFARTAPVDSEPEAG